MSVAKWIDTYGIHHWRILWSSYIYTYIYIYIYIYIIYMYIKYTHTHTHVWSFRNVYYCDDISSGIIDEFLNHCPMRTAVLCQPLSKCWYAGFCCFTYNAFHSNLSVEEGGTNKILGVFLGGTQKWGNNFQRGERTKLGWNYIREVDIYYWTKRLLIQYVNKILRKPENLSFPL